MYQRKKLPDRIVIPRGYGVARFRVINDTSRRTWPQIRFADFEIHKLRIVLLLRKMLLGHGKKAE